MKLIFSEVNSRLCFCAEVCMSSLNRSVVIKSEGEIPEEIIVKGVGSIRAFARSKAKREIDEKIKIFRIREEFANNPDYPVSAEFDGKTLKGRIVSAANSILRVELERPFLGSKAIRYGCISAMAGKYIFREDGTFSEDALDSARGLLVSIYKENMHQKKNKKIIDLVNDLNES